MAVFYPSVQEIEERKKKKKKDRVILQQNRTSFVTRLSACFFKSVYAREDCMRSFMVMAYGLRITPVAKCQYGDK